MTQNRYTKSEDYEQRFRNRINVDEDEEDASSAIGSYNPTQIWLTRVMLDRYFEMESHLSLVLNSTKIGFLKISKNIKRRSFPQMQLHTTSAKKQKQVAEFLAEERASIMSGWPLPSSLLQVTETIVNSTSKI